MRILLSAGIVLLTLLPAAAQPAGEADETVVACESLIGLRQLTAAAGADRDRAADEVPNHPGCRLVPRKQLGAVERRSMFGGAPYECVATGSGPCVWLMP